MRGLSALKSERAKAAEKFPDAAYKDLPPYGPEVVIEVEKALYFSFIITYAQGMSLLDDASREYDYGLNMETIARIWRGGCIIRADLLEDIRKVYRAQPDLTNMLLSEEFTEVLNLTAPAVRSLLKKAIDAGVPTLTMSSALNYFDAYRSARLPLNLVQAQRDFFGSHTYERIDRDGIFHTEWGI
jgi:6-phosphogluconate dehydrogenase